MDDALCKGQLTHLMKVNRNLIDEINNKNMVIFKMRKRIEKLENQLEKLENQLGNQNELLRSAVVVNSDEGQKKPSKKQTDVNNEKTDDGGEVLPGDEWQVLLKKKIVLKF